MKRFTFKKHPVSRICALDNRGRYYDIKYGNAVVGCIEETGCYSHKFKIRLKIRKSQVELDDPNRTGPCEWKWVTLMPVFENEKLAKEYLKTDFKEIYANLYIEE